MTRFSNARLAVRHALAALVILAVPVSAIAADEAVERTKGYFCDSRSDLIAFLSKLAEGETDIMAANAVNKAAGVQSCAYYISVAVIPTGEKTVMESGLVFATQGYIFLPERIERWSGTLFGSLQQRAGKEQI